MLRSKLVLVALSVLIVPAALQASVINGVSPGLPKDFFIPQNTDGVMGQLLGGGPLAYTSDRNLLHAGDVRTGSVAVNTNFTFPDDMDSANAVVSFTFNDLDLKPQTLGKNVGRLTEWIEFQVYTDIYTGSPLASLTLTGSNYGNYRPDGAGETNNKHVVYSFDLVDDFGLSQTQIDAINAGPPNSFWVKAIMHSMIEQFGNKPTVYRNTSETYGASFAYLPTPAPEPVTMAVLAIGLPLLLRRRRNA